jgi:4-amino-4-deoxy-L-arabinose transferase-like glycosyltransferase
LNPAGGTEASVEIEARAQPPKVAPTTGRWSSPLVWLIAPLLSGACWLVVWRSVPNAEFPLADEWAFGRGALDFAAGHGIHYYNWASMPLFGQWIWAWPFVKIFGPSYFSLRLSVICLSWLGLIAFQFLMVESAGASHGIALLAASAFALSPLFFVLQAVFLTDLASLSFALVALALFERGRKTGSLRVWLLASLPAVFAVATRQNMAAVPVVAALVLWREPGFRQRPAWWVPILVPLVCAAGIYTWFQQRPDARLIHFKFSEPTTIVVAPYVTLIIAGLVALPVLLVIQKRRSYRPLAWALAAVLATQAYWWYYRKLLPYGGLYPFIHGMITPSGAYSENMMAGTRPAVLPEPWRWILTILGCLAAAALLERIWLRRKGSWSILTLFTVLQIPFLFFAPWLYDRYLLVFLPGLIAAGVVTVEAVNVKAWPAALAWLAGSAALSVALVHDWYSWNIARWQLGERAVQVHQISPRRIEGGFEWDGNFNQVSGDAPIPAPRLALKDVHFWFPKVTGEYAISFTPLKDSVAIDREPYRLWLGGDHDLLLLKEQAAR